MSVGHALGMKTLRRHTQPVGGDNQSSQEGIRDTHLGFQEDSPSESQGNRAPHTQLQQEHLHNWIMLRDPPAGQRCCPSHPHPGAYFHLPSAYMGLAKASPCTMSAPSPLSDLNP